MSDRYRPAGTNKEFTDIMARARSTNRERDLIEKACNIPVARDSGPAAYLKAAIDAIECGVMVREWDAVAEGLAMLQDMKGRYAIVLGSSKKALRQRTSV